MVGLDDHQILIGPSALSQILLQILLFLTPADPPEDGDTELLWVDDEAVPMSPQPQSSPISPTRTHRAISTAAAASRRSDEAPSEFKTPSGLIPCAGLPCCISILMRPHRPTVDWQLVGWPSQQPLSSSRRMQVLGRCIQCLQCCCQLANNYTHSCLGRGKRWPCGPTRSYIRLKTRDGCSQSN